MKALRNVDSVQALHTAVSKAVAQLGHLDAQSVSSIASKLVRLARCPSRHLTPPPPPPPLQPQQHHHSPPLRLEQQQQQQGAAPTEEPHSHAHQARVFAKHTWRPLLLNSLGDMDAAGLCICAHAAVQLGFADDPALSEALMQAAEPKLRAASPRAQAQILWSLVSLRAAPPEPWLRRWVAASLPCLAQYTHQDLGQALWALARLRWVPPEPWVRAVLRMLRARVPACNGQSLVMAVWALARLQLAPPPELLDACCARVQQLVLQQQQQQQQQEARDVAVGQPAVYSHTGIWDGASGSTEQQRQAQHTHPGERQGVVGPQALAMLAYALVLFQHTPSPEFLEVFTAAAGRCMHVATTQVCACNRACVCVWGGGVCTQAATTQVVPRGPGASLLFVVGTSFIICVMLWFHHSFSSCLLTGVRLRQLVSLRACPPIQSTAHAYARTHVPVVTQYTYTTYTTHTCTHRSLLCLRSPPPTGATARPLPGLHGSWPSPARSCAASAHKGWCCCWTHLHSRDIRLLLGGCGEWMRAWGCT